MKSRCPTIEPQSHFKVEEGLPGPLPGRELRLSFWRPASHLASGRNPAPNRCPHMFLGKIRNTIPDLLTSPRSNKIMLGILRGQCSGWGGVGWVLWFEIKFTVEFCPKTRASVPSFATWWCHFQITSSSQEHYFQFPMKSGRDVCWSLLKSLLLGSQQVSQKDVWSPPMAKEVDLAIPPLLWSWAVINCKASLHTDSSSYNLQQLQFKCGIWCERPVPENLENCFHLE